MSRVDRVARQRGERPDALSPGKGGVERFAWRDARGRLKEMACRKQLIALERRGKLALPAARREPPRPRADQAPASVWPEVSGSLGDLGMITLQPIDGGTAASKTWHAMMAAHHPLGA